MNPNDYKRKASNRFFESVANIGNIKPELQLQHSNAISNTAFRVMATHAKTKGITANDYADMVSVATNGLFRVVAESIQPLPSRNPAVGSEKVSMIIEANTRIEEFNEEEVSAKMKVITASIFEDGESNLWRVVEANGKKILVQTQSEDFERILKDRINDSPVLAYAANNFHGIVPGLGDFVVFYDAENMEVRAGLSAYIDHELYIADMKTEDFKKIATEQVIETISASSIEGDKSPVPGLVKLWERKNETKAADEPTENDFTSRDAVDVLSYFRNLYAGTEYYTDMIKLVAERRNFGKNDRPLIQNVY